MAEPGAYPLLASSLFLSEGALGAAEEVLNHGADPRAGYEKPKRDDDVIQEPIRDEINALLAHAPPHLVRALSLSYYIGLRPGNAELFRLTWAAVDWSGKPERICVISAKKGGIKKRWVPVHEEFTPILRAWYEADERPGGHIVHYKGRPITSIKGSFATAKKKAGITRRLRPYDFRHAFATRVLEQGGDLKSTSEILGHSRTDTTTRIYQHTDVALHQKTVNKLPPITIPSAKE